MIKTILLALFILYPAAGLADDSPFSSADERNFVLRTAGLDGQIDQTEWTADRPHFQNLTWQSLQSYDQDGDSLISLNEFFRFVKHQPNLPDGMAGTAVQPGTRPALRTASLTMDAPAPKKTQVLTRRQLFQRAHIARRTKFMKPLNPDIDFLAEKQRAEQLKVMTDRRRDAADQLTSKTGEERRRLRDLYKSRLVKNRFSAASPEESGSTKRAKLNSTRNRSSGSSEGPSWRRALLNDRMQRGRSKDQPDGGTANPLPSSRSKEIQKQTPRTREASNIRNLIPRSKADGSKARQEIKDVERKR
jgi:hypothetical protein